MDKIKCPICYTEVEESNFKETYVSPYNNQEYKRYECPNCDVHWWEPLKIIPEFYESEVFEDYVAFHEGIGTRLGENHKAFFKYFPSNMRGKLLDVGCGDGRFLRYAKEQGFEVWGIDFDKKSVENVKRNLSIDTVFAMSLEEFYEYAKKRGLRFLATETRRRLFENFLSLSFLQVANYIFPLITFPYLVRVLGPEKFGLISFAQAFTGYFVILTDYGFNLSATREIAIYREDKEKVSEIFSSVMVIKFFLFFLSLGIMSAIIFTFEKFRKDWEIYYLTFGMVLGQVLFPVWFFQGMERMKYITFLNILAKLIFTIAIFLFVRKIEDYLYVPLLNSLGFIVAGILGLWIIFKDFGIEFKMPSWKEIKYQLKEGWYIFISQISVSFFNNTNTVVLGLLTNNTIVGYYSAAEKLIRVIINLQIPIVNSIYPVMAKLVKENIKKAIKLANKLLIYGTCGYLILLILLWLFSHEIIVTVIGENFKKSEIIFKILLIIPLTIFINNIYGTQFLLNMGYSKIFFKILILSGLFNLTLCPILTYLWNYIGTALSWVVVEIFVLYGMYYYATKYMDELKLKYIFNFFNKNK